MGNLFKIGEVSKLCDISIKTLRYYEEFGLIMPVEIDKFTGYRYYNESNIESIYKIQFLKNLGLSLQDIKDFDKDSIDKVYKSLRLELKEIKNKLNMLSSLKKQKGDHHEKEASLDWCDRPCSGNGSSLAYAFCRR